MRLEKSCGFSAVSAHSTGGLAARQQQQNGVSQEGGVLDTLPRTGHWMENKTKMAAGGGFEPPLTGPEPVVLPLHHPAASH